MRCVLQTLLHLALHLLLGTAANAHADDHKHHKHHSHKQKQRPQEQHGASDYVIVGGGSAGCALAARLCTGLPHASITLLERSKPRNASLDLTVSAIRNSFDTWANPDVAERWQSEPNPGLDGRTVDLITGNTLGGTSAHSATDLCSNNACCCALSACCSACLRHPRRRSWLASSHTG
jgi:GMC oxidoreductase